MALNGQNVALEILRTVAFGAISNTYALIGTSFSNPARMIMIDNLTDADMYISDDGINDKFILASRSGRVFDWGSNRVAKCEQLEQKAGTRLYVRAISTLPLSGNVGLTVVYADTV